ncbi:MAG: hypothetical protein ATN36_04255 [Epulopiscium sp. Nele67-Bin005]|nr:MAG: hypothetical protein ATN36_04255 [Epulopiscium sp. Nele67-Bin005]
MKMGLYIHVPFCNSKCYYCDFLSFSNLNLQEEYKKVLRKELINYSTKIRNCKIKTIFIGGGTPTVLAPNFLREICETITKYFVLDESLEWTIEVNPNTLTNEHIEIFKNLPINRISLGLQSIFPHHLKNIGRIHTFEQWENCIEQLINAGITNINTDLMFALPNQSLEEWEQTLITVVKYPITHISAYALIIEEGTPFFRQYEKGELELIDEKLDREMYNSAKIILAEHGFNHYEISNWSKNNLECKHNLVYWNCEQYLGVGLGASGYLDGVRYTNVLDLKKYIASNGEISKIQEVIEPISPQMSMEEFMFLGLRLIDGVKFEDFEKIFGESLEKKYKFSIQKWIKQKALVKTIDGIKLTPYGIDISNQVFTSFLE